MNEAWEGWPVCPCGCGVEALKLQRPLKRGPRVGESHVVGCRCASHTAIRSRRKGQAGQHDMHIALGGRGPTPTHEESGRGYPIVVLTTDGESGITNVQTDAVKVHPESKRGGQVPASLVKFLGTDWYRRALSQSERSLPVGSGATPAVWCQMPGGRKVLIVDYGGGR